MVADQIFRDENGASGDQVRSCLDSGEDCVLEEAIFL